MSCTKTKFKTEVDAERALNHIKDVRRKYRREKKPNRYYLCDMCHSYHLTSKEELPEDVNLLHEKDFKLLLEKGKAPFSRGFLF